MAGDWRAFALEKAEMLSGRLRDLLSSGQGYVSAQLGVDLGLKPELYPTWLVLSTAAIGLLLVLALSWAAVCGGLLAGKKRGSPVSQSNGELDKARLARAAKPDEQKKRNKRKAPEKKTQSNGQPVTAAQEEAKVEGVSKTSPQMKAEKVPSVQAPAQAKKKKTKATVKPAQHVSTTDGKEPDDGAWETKVSNREKRQQRRKDKGPESPGSPGGVEASKTHLNSTVATTSASTKKNIGSHESSHPRTTGKGDSASGAVHRQEPSVNGGGWTDFSLKIPGQMGTMDGTKWGSMPGAPHYRTQPEPQSWAQETRAAWSGIDCRIKPDLNPGPFSMLGLNTTDPISKSMELQWASHPNVDDEWSGVNNVASVDPSSDWNAPVEHWGNYEEPPVLVTPAPLLKEQPIPKKVSEDERDTEDATGGAAKSKKKRKKKKKTEEEATSEAKAVTPVTPANAAPKPQELPVLASKKQIPSISSSQKKTEQVAEPAKPSQKKKVRRET